MKSRRLTCGIAVILLTLIVMGCHSLSPAERAAESKAKWSGQMQNMAQDVRKLLPYLYNRKAYQDPKNHKAILEYLQEFSQAAHGVPVRTGQLFLGDDLLVEYSLANLKDDLGRAIHTFEIGQTEYSRTVAKASLSHCFRCHSVAQPGGSASWNLNQISKLNLAPLEKADLLVATRKYDQALAYMEGLLNSDAYLKDYTFDYESMLRRYLALIIRVKHAPIRALRELNDILEHKDVPHYIAEQAQGWRQSLKDWAHEKKRPVRNAKQLFHEVELCFKRADRIQHFKSDHAGDVEYLRATALLHHGLQYIKTAHDQARALYLLGEAYEVLDELGSWNLHESYYEACLLKAPRTALARLCYDRLEASLYMGYSGSSGTHLPPEERARLRRLRKLLK